MFEEKFLDPNSCSLRDTFERSCSLIENEAIYLDEGRWDDWLALYAEDVRYWAPSWRGDGRLTSDPELEFSHIFYDRRSGLEDRVKRIRSKDSPASNPAPRTTHVLGSFRLLEGSNEEESIIRCTWLTHAYYIQSKATHTFSGRSRFKIKETEKGMRIIEKTIILNNDYTPTLIDLYFL